MTRCIFTKRKQLPGHPLTNIRKTDYFSKLTELPVFDLGLCSMTLWCKRDFPPTIYDLSLLMERNKFTETDMGRHIYAVIV